MAIGKPDFVEMAIDMALSYKYFNAEPLSCIVDYKTKGIIEKKYPSIFDELIILPENFKLSRTRKFSCAELTPYESTVFIDSDILLLNSISHLWDEGELNNYITMIGHYIDNKSSIVHHGFSVSELIRMVSINKYLKTNSGFFHFMKEPGKLFFNVCIEKYTELRNDPKINQQGWLGDEIAIGITGDQFNVFCFRSPSPMMWDDKLAVLKKNDNSFPLCHFIAPIPPLTVKWLIKRAKNLRKLKGIPTGGEKVWEKLNNKRRMSYDPTMSYRIKNKIRSYIFKYLRKNRHKV